LTSECPVCRLTNVPGDDFEKKRSQAVIRAQVQKELEEQKKVLLVSSLLA
jgi:hypothetical protein